MKHLYPYVSDLFQDDSAPPHRAELWLDEDEYDVN